MAATTGAVGLLVERAAGFRVPVGLLPALGFALVIVVATAIYTLGGQTPIVLAAVGVLAVAGLLVGRRGLRKRLRVGWLGAAGVAVYGLYLFPVIASGEWTWTGYNFVNDTVTHFLLIDYLSQTGTDAVTGPVNNATAVQGLLTNATYPIGAHAPLAAALAVIPAPLEATYNPYIAFAAGLAAYAFGVLLTHAGLSPRLAALGAVLAATASLTYQYALQGNFKELIVLTLVAAAAALIAVILREDGRSARTIGAPALCAVAAVPVFSAGAFAYAGALALTLVGALLVSPLRLDLRRGVGWLALGTGIAALATIPLLGQLTSFAKDAVQRFSDSGEGGTAFDTTAVLGHLVRPLDPAQLAGVWFRGDYRFPVAGPWSVPNTVVIAIILALAVAGIALELRRRRPAALLFALPVLMVVLAAGSVATPYIDGKLYAIASPAALLLAAVAVHYLADGFGRPGRLVAGGLTAVVAGGVILSTAFAYHEVRLAPVDKLREVASLEDRLSGGPWLVNEWEEFNKYYLRDREVNAANEAVFSAKPAVYRRTDRPLQGRWYSLDEYQLEYIQSFPGLLTRRSPAESRPPASFRRAFGSANYEGWRASGSPTVVEHFPVGTPNSAAAVPNCRAVRRMADKVRPGQQLLAAVPPESVALEVSTSAPPSWPRVGSELLDVDPLTVIPTSPADFVRPLAVKGGRYEVWARGNFPRPITISVAGREVGKASGADGPGQWDQVGEVSLDAGVHSVRLQRPGGRLAPGDGLEGVVGPVVLRKRGETQVIKIDSSRPRSVCGRPLDWLERVRN